MAVHRTLLSWHSIMIVVFLGFVAIQFTGALRCFQCAYANLDSDCYNDYEGFVNTSKGIGDKYNKNCSASNPRWDRCVIETHQGLDGKYTLFRRDCHDGEYFNKDIDDLEFHNLTANNFTTCASVKNKLVCFTFCDTDLCNGPEPVPDCDYYIERNMTSEIPDDLICGGIGIHSKHFSTLVSMDLVTIFVVWLLKRWM